MRKAGHALTACRLRWPVCPRQSLRSDGVLPPALCPGLSQPMQSPQFFAGRQASIFFNGVSVGNFGVVHPEVGAWQLTTLLTPQPHSLALASLAHWPHKLPVLSRMCFSPSLLAHRMG